MAEFRLHCFGESGNSYKAALPLHLAGADWEPVFVDFFGGAQRSDAFRELNEMAEAPVLEHDGLVLTQSGVILDYLAEKLGRYGGGTPEEEREILRWILFDNHKFTSYAATRRFMLAFMGTGETPVTEFLGQRMKSAWTVLEKHMEGRAFVVGDRPTIADFSLSAYLHYGDELAWSFEPYPAISAWVERIRALPGWKHPYELMRRGFPGAAT
ncbi:glutathione S-transferase [Methylopila sp. M107]|uniref:glutathione S-transferase family protein n=1 Tax=Methylopila sp. M107 TaxID=1101190 RepID=UPI00037B61C7|nr:glutathione S-transferase [Methylopila sp. M107]